MKMKCNLIVTHTTVRVLVLLLCWSVIQPTSYTHFSQPDPCAQSYNDWQTAKAISDEKEATYNDMKETAARAISTAITPKN